MSKSRGAALVELAIVLPVILMMVFGITELGRALYQLNSLAKATDGGVRYLSRSWAVLDDNCQPTSGWSAAAAATANYVAFGNAGGQGQPLLPGLSTASVSVTAVYGEVAGSEGSACIILVEASVPFQGVFGENIVPFTRLGPIDLTTRREARYIGE
jgi:Flp pilus assembly protein TadG